jgi:hypothetical protein
MQTLPTIVQHGDDLAAWLAFSGALLVALIAAATAQWRLRAQLAAERERLAVSLAAEASRSRWNAVREQLNSGAVLLTRFQGMTGELKQVAPGELTLPSGWDDTVAEVGAFRGQLRLWFPDEDEVVKAFDDVLSHAVWASELREGIDTESRPPGVSQAAFDALRPHVPDQIRRDIDEHRKRYLDAAREHLRTHRDPAAL